VKSDSSTQESATSSPRLTRNQQAVLDVLHQQADALSAQELYNLLRAFARTTGDRAGNYLSGIRNAEIAWIDQKSDGGKR